jgi:hypothetical protein
MIFWDAQPIARSEHRRASVFSPRWIPSKRRIWTTLVDDGSRNAATLLEVLQGLAQPRDE